MLGDIALRAVGADDSASLRELMFARVVALADEASRRGCSQAERRAREFEMCVRSIASDPQLADLHERLLPVARRVRQRRLEA